MQDEEIFRTIPQCAWFSQGGRRKRQKPCNILTRKLSWKSSSTTHQPFLLSNPKILKALPKTFPYKMKPTKCPATEKKIRREKKKKWGGEKWKKKSRAFCACPNFTLTNILHLDQEAAKCTTCKQICGKFSLLKARQLIIRKQINYQNAIFGKISRIVWVNEGLTAIKN